MDREDLLQIRKQWRSWAPFVRSDYIPLDRKPRTPVPSTKPGAWAPFKGEDTIPLEREPHLGSRRQKPIKKSAIGHSSRPYGPYPWCVQHLDGSTGGTSDSGLGAWAAQHLKQAKPEDVLDDSSARLKWLELKKKGKSNAHLDAVMSIIGPQLEPVKEHFLFIWERFSGARADQVIPPKFFNLALKGADKNSKQRIAYMYALFLQSLGVVEDERSEQELSFAKKGGMRASSSTVILLLLPQTEDHDSPCHKSAYMFTFETTLSVPEYKKRDFDDLRSLVVRTKEAKGISIEPADEGVVIDCLARQAAKTSSPLFDDANNVSRVINRACEKMKQRNTPHEKQSLRKQAQKHWEKAARQHQDAQSRQGRVLESPANAVPSGDAEVSDSPNPVSGLTLEDVVGPPIPDLKTDNKAWQQLQGMIGLDEIKQEFAQMIDFAQRKKEKERLGLEMPRTFSLHRLFLGPPGVGKTTVAKLYGQLILDLGLVSGSRPAEESPDPWGRYSMFSRQPSLFTHKEPTMVDPSHLIGPYIGHSERNTTKYLSRAKGGVLVIDEAHMLYTSRANGENSSDVFRIAVIDKIVAEVNADGDEDRCVILVGYPDRMEEMFLHSNHGLQRRFPKETAMVFKTFTTDQLLQICSGKMDAEKIRATEDALKVVKQVLARMRINPKFGNAGDVCNLLETARRRHLANNSHQSTWSLSAKPLELEPQDIDPRWNRLLSADNSREALFETFVGFESITDRFEQYRNKVVGMERLGIDPRPQMPWNFVFEGPPGTGKTSTARNLGQLYYDLGLLSTDEVVECSVRDLLDTTGLKLNNMLEKSLGKVLFIDEAYRLVATVEGYLTTGELVDAVTKTRYDQNLVIVLAGYTKDMDKLLGVNPGLRSRFPERIQFPPLSGEACKELLEKKLRRHGITIEDHVEVEKCGVTRGFRRLSRTPGWANGRDVETLNKSIANAVFAKVGKTPVGNTSDKLALTVSRREVDEHMLVMYKDRTRAGQEAKDTVPGQARRDDSDSD